LLSTSVPQTGPSIEVSSPSGHRRGRGSISGSGSINEQSSNGSIGGKIRGVRDRLVRDRSASRNRGKSPPRTRDFARSPYESIGDIDRSKTAPPMNLPMQTLSLQSMSSQPDSGAPLTLSAVSYNAAPTLSATTYNSPPTLSSQAYSPSVTTGYRNPKDIARATMNTNNGPDRFDPSTSSSAVGGTMASTMSGYRNPKEIARAAMAAQQGQSTTPPYEVQFGLNAERPPPAVKSQNVTAGYRNPKEIRANMPPRQSQAGTGPMPRMNGAPF